MKKNRFCRNQNVSLPGTHLPMAMSILEAIQSQPYRTSISDNTVQLLRNGDQASLRSILDLEIDPNDYSDPETFRNDYLSVSLLSKYPFSCGYDRKDRALSKWSEAEVRCALFNDRLALGGETKWSPAFWSTIQVAKRKIERVLGPFNWDLVLPYVGFGPGATPSLRRFDATTEKKLHLSNECTESCYPLVKSYFSYMNGYSEHISNFAREFKIQDYAKITTVPKNGKTDRVIAIEPNWNMFFQKGLGGLIRNRLCRVGLNLDRQAERNAELARVGSLSNDLVTIDLSSASDSICYSLVQQLVPHDWFDALELVRTRSARLPSGEIINLQKFSSMGNGYTFELETLLFWALCTSCQEEKDPLCAVFGDDIIVKSTYSKTVISTLSDAGFTVNRSKTHLDGPFRESCGKHYFLGRDVTPFYFRTAEENLASVLQYSNKIKRWCRHPVWGYDTILRSAYNYAVSCLPGSWRKPRIPDGYGDGALFGSFDEVVPSVVQKGTGVYRSHIGYSCKVLLPINRAKAQSGSVFAVFASLYHLERRKSIICTPPTGQFTGKYKVGRIIVPQWSTVDGPWLDQL